MIFDAPGTSAAAVMLFLETCQKGKYPPPFPATWVVNMGNRPAGCAPASSLILTRWQDKTPKTRDRVKYALFFRDLGLGRGKFLRVLPLGSLVGVEKKHLPAPGTAIYSKFGSKIKYRDTGTFEARYFFDPLFLFLPIFSPASVQTHQGTTHGKTAKSMAGYFDGAATSRGS